MVEKKHIVREQTFWKLLEARVAATPDQLMLVEGDHKKLKATFAEFIHLAEKLAAGLHAQGIGPDSVVAWQMPTRLHSAVLFFALLRLGAVQNPILHLFRERELTDLLTQTKPNWLLVPGADKSCDYPAQGKSVCDKLGCKLMVLGDEWPQGDIAELPAVPNDGDAVRWLFCTSGTTSGPKAVLHTDSTLIAGGHALADSFIAEPNDVYSICYPIAHIGGAMSFGMILELGMPSVLIERFDPKTTSEVFRQYKVTITGGSTAHYQAWLALQDQTPGQPVLPDLRMLNGGGAAKPAQLYIQAVEKMGVPIVHSYGMTESPLVAANSPASSEHALLHTDGKAVTGMDVRIQRADGSWADTSEVGEVVVRGDCLCKGYLNPEQTKEAFDEQGYYHTGDLASADENGYISLTGRLKDIIIRKGENISAREIEELLMDYPGVDAVAVIGLPDEVRGERVCAVLEFSGEPPTLKDLTGYLTEQGLMKIKLPEQLEIVDRLPRSEALGKVSKKNLQAQFASSSIAN